MVRWRALLQAGLAASLVCLFAGATPVLAAKRGGHAKLDNKLNERATKAGKSRVIITLKPGWDVSTEVRKAGGKFGRRLSLINGRSPSCRTRNSARSLTTRASRAFTGTGRPLAA